MPSPGGYSITPGLYRVPNLLTEEQFVQYMKDTYGREIEFVDTHNSVDPSRALGQTSPMGVLDESAAPNAFTDPVLRRLNEMDFSNTAPVEDKTPEKKPASKSTSSK